MRQVVVLLLVVACYVCITSALDIGFKGNVSWIKDINKGGGDWDYRDTGFDVWDIGIAAGVSSFSKAVNTTSLGSEGNAMWTAAYYTFGNCLVVWLAKWEKNATFDKNTNFLEVDVTTASAFMANSYYVLHETDPSGNKVATGDLTHHLGFNYDISSVRTNGTLKWVTFTGSAQGQPWTIDITCVVSSVVGELDNGGIVSPQSLETIVEIFNWPYQNTNNTLSLVMGVATGSSSSNNHLLVSGTPSKGQVYFQVAGQAIVKDNKSKNVTVGGFVPGNFEDCIDDYHIKKMLQSKYNNSWETKTVTVTFPPGEPYILYDPSVGAGAVPGIIPTDVSSASHLALSAAVLLALLVGLFAVNF
jgi:hypothetical protein